MNNYRLDLMFDGSRYRGWQRLKGTEATIQGKLEQVLTRLTREPVQVVGCGRTDAGVHAESYIANFHLKTAYTPERLWRSLDQYLPEDIVVRSLDVCEPRFHARFHATGKTYVYRIDRRNRPSPFTRRYRLHCPEALNIAAMRGAAALFLGEHDFRCFTTQRSEERSLKRTIYALQIDEREEEMSIAVCGDGFLWNMVRIIAAGLLDVGRNPEHAPVLCGYLDSADRAVAAAMLPAHGLFLQQVSYAPAELL